MITPNHQPKRSADAAKWRAFDETIAEIRGRFTDMPPDKPEAVIDEALAAIRGGSG